MRSREREKWGSEPVFMAMVVRTKWHLICHSDGRRLHGGGSGGDCGGGSDDNGPGDGYFA